MSSILKELSGAWEEPGVIGTRIEIEKNTITILWQNICVLKTKFTTSKISTDGEYALYLKDNSMKYPHSSTPYATVTYIRYKDGCLTFNEMFPITGENIEILKKTENSRYGNYDIVDDKFVRELSGTWTSDDNYTTFVFSKNKVSFNGSTINYHVLQNKNYPSEFTIVDEDSSKHSLFYFTNIRFTGDMIFITIPVCDAPSIDIILRKK